MTGYWVSVVNEDWRWRMLTPPQGDFESVPLNDDGERVGNLWTPELDGQCEAYGVGGLMRMPTRLHITWQDEGTMQIETDAGSQIRRLSFDASTPVGPRTLQGHSVASWERPGGRGGRGGRGRGVQLAGGNLRVETTNVTAGWLRRNGAPYSQDAAITEYFDRFPTPDDDEWLVVITVVRDPTYLTGEFITSTHFKREPDGSKWTPTTCR